MGLHNFEKNLRSSLEQRAQQGILKGEEKIIDTIIAATHQGSPRYTIEGYDKQHFLKMNSNSYLGLSFHHQVIQAEERAVTIYGTGPGSVRFIHGSFKPHTDLEKKLAQFHQFESAMLFSSAYLTMIGCIPALTDEKTTIISDELNHNCIINAIRLARPQNKLIYKHLDINDLEAKIQGCIGQTKKIILISDGIFSMRGVCAPVDILGELKMKYSDKFDEGILLILDDSHGVGVMGDTGRGSVQHCNGKGVDIIAGTLGKAFGVNGGYIVSTSYIIDYLRETATTYIYTNPITAAEAAAALAAVTIVDSKEGLELLSKIRSIAAYFQKGLLDSGYSIIKTQHPIVPLLIGDSKETKSLVSFFFKKGVLVTGITYPVVPRGDEEIRFQVSALHTTSDIDYVLQVLKDYKKCT